MSQFEDRRYADIAVPLNLHTLTYWVPEQMRGEISVGQRVVISIRQSRYVGVVWRLHAKEPAYPGIKVVEKILSPSPILSPLQIKLAEWVSRYYMSENEVKK